MKPHLHIVEKSEKTPKQITGQQGEDIASEYLINEHYLLLHRNWRNGRSEIDIIAAKGNTLHFIEVKTRTGKHFGLPETKVDADKLKQMKLAGAAFLAVHTQWKFIQFDIIAINLEVGKQPEIFMIPDIF